MVILIAAVTFISRIINLLIVPIFTDEAIYIRWAQIGLNDPVHRYISLTDGKQPLLTWAIYPFLKIFADPLYAGRFVSVLAGVATVVGIYFVTKELFDKKTALFASIIYILSPFTILYDRLALMDSLLSTFAIWSLYLEILLVRRIRLDVGLILGLTIGLGLLTKSSAFFFLYLLPFSLLLFDYRKKHSKKRLVKWVSLSSLSFIMAQVIYNSLRLSPWFYIIEQKNFSFIYSFREILSHPFSVFIPNLHGLIPILYSYLTPPLFLLLTIGIIFGLIKSDKKIFLLFIWFVIPFLALAIFGKIIFPRFILFMVLPLFIISAHTLAVFTAFLSGRNIKLLLLIPIILLIPAYQSFLAITNPVQMSISVIDRNQLFDDWPSGYGVREVISYLREQSKEQKIVIGTEGTFGLNPAVYEIYLGTDNKNVEIYGFWPVNEVPTLLLEKAKTYPTYLIFKEKNNVPSSWPLTLVEKYRRGQGNTYLLFYRVNRVQT